MQFIYLYYLPLLFLSFRKSVDILVVGALIITDVDRSFSSYRYILNSVRFDFKERNLRINFYLNR